MRVFGSALLSLRRRSHGSSRRNRTQASKVAPPQASSDQKPTWSSLPQIGSMSAVCMRVAMSDWWPSRRTRSVMCTLAMNLQSLMRGYGGRDGGCDHFRRFLFGVLGEFRVFVDEAGVEAPAAELGVLEDFLVVGDRGLHAVDQHVGERAAAAREGRFPVQVPY